MTTAPQQTTEAREERAQLKLARRNFLGFIRYTKPDYQVEWYHRLLSEFLELVRERKITRAMVIMPPRHGKSEQVSRRFPAYCFARNPDEQIIACSYGQDLANEMSRDVQTIIQDDRYKQLTRNQVLLPGDLDPAERRRRDAQTDKKFTIGLRKGQYRAAGVGGPITGLGMTIGVIDDPFKNREEADSETMRNKVWHWYKSTFLTRIESSNSSILITHTRWHEDDLVGRLLKEAREEPDADKWHVLWLPAVAEEEVPREYADNPGVTLWGRHEDRKNRDPGDTLWDVKMKKEDVPNRKIGAGDREWASLFQGRPRPEGGNIIKEAWLGSAYIDGDYLVYDDQRRIHKRYLDKFQMVDLATSLKESADYTCVGSFWGDRGADRLTLVDCWYGRVGGGEHQRIIMRQAQRNECRWTGVETGQFQLALIQQMQSSQLPVREVQPDNDKVARAYAACPFMERGGFYCTNFRDRDLRLDELVGFPNTAHDDFTDVVVYGVLHWDGSPRSSGPVPIDNLGSDRSAHFNPVRPVRRRPPRKR